MRFEHRIHTALWSWRGRNTGSHRGVEEAMQTFLVGLGLVAAAGVDTVVELANRNPANLFQRMLETNDAKNLVRRPPVQSQVSDWVAEAKQLPRVIQY
jgi:hypothetical protein